ncbi:hypothetical protein RSOL_244850 [Rhizoctonia solani AG-3 Rhs1AP]|uniref:Uncharacterized protein n=1 Tax=Rhizoctonia solani AG-3 Rhs1AP TaxID=1086054 RepID=A0A0A1UJ77_9AGAM|nr:hypothetical protein RSOL_244850 [Rhizoctonia solani AG-3 Rhs1AP]
MVCYTLKTPLRTSNRSILLGLVNTMRITTPPLCRQCQKCITWLPHSPMIARVVQMSRTLPRNANSYTRPKMMMGPRIRLISARGSGKHPWLVISLGLVVSLQNSRLCLGRLCTATFGLN